jgi:hypothetical protein
MATVADPARPVGAGSVRHGTCRLTIEIKGQAYRLRPLPPASGTLAAWQLRKLSASHVARYIVTAPKGAPARCTCPDHEESGWTCKHIGALTAAGLIPAPKPVKARKVSPGRARQLHAKNARQAIGQAQALINGPPVRVAPENQGEGWVNGGAHPSFAAGFGQAVRAHVGQLRGEEIPTGPSPDYLLCEMCDQPFEPHAGRYREFCPECQGGVV